MGFVKRRGSTKVKIAIEDFEAVKKLYLLGINNVVQINEIPPDVVVNWDQTRIHYVPVSSWTIEACGSKRVQI